MSTKSIRKALQAMADTLDVGMGGLVLEALADVEAIERAAKTLEAESLGDWVYDVRDRAAADTSFTGNTWEHPRVVAYGEAAQVITNIAKESNA